MSTARGRMVTELGSDAPSMARGALANVSGALLTTSLSFGLVLLITHVVNKGQFGLFTFASTIILIAQVPALLGLDTGAVRFVALGAAADEEGVARGSLQTSLLIASVASATLTGILLLLAPWLAQSFLHDPNGAHGAQATHLIRIVSLSLPALALGRVVIAGLQGLGIMRYSAWLNPIAALVNIVAAAPLLAAGLGVRGLAYASLITAWGTLLIGLALLLEVHPTALRPAPAHWAFGRVLRFSLPQTLTTMLLNAILWTDILLLSHFRPSADVANYRIAQQLLSPAQTISTSTGQMFAPRIAAEDARGDRAMLGMMLKRVTYWNIALSLPVFAVLLLLPRPLLGLFGHRYEQGATALAILAGGQLFNAATGPLGQVINMSGRPYITMANNAAVAALNVVGCLILIPKHGMIGAAISTTGAVTLVNVIKLVQVRMIFGINPFRAHAVRSVAAAVLAALVVGPIAAIWPWSSPILEVGALAPLLLVVYLWLFWTFAAGTEERALMRRRRRRGGPSLL
jgi:O-antigen/teichoic acid export membrane protein